MDRDSKLIVYKYLHNLLMADTIKELKLCIRREWQGGSTGRVHLIKYKFNKNKWWDWSSIYSWDYDSCYDIPLKIVE